MRAETHTPDAADRLRRGGRQALGAVFAEHRERIRRRVAWHLARDPRLAGRFDASDVVQETYGDAERQFDAYLRSPAAIPPAAWLHRLAWERLLKFRREHLDALCRTVKRQRPLPEESGMHPALETPSSGGDERTPLVRRALTRLKPADQEVIRLRLLEGRDNREVAALLGVGEEAAAKRFARAMRRLKEATARPDGGGQP